ncbi:hypothetical protein LOTGIDRAFT_108350 [Lottia gigantea]|uniref:Calpain catalytic domain-containing protein n=1 Tax=Lottia gigantea TaxID=225164 RepID=V3ZTI1_LOTGI|nr:hypothetical protein LOTGIDRAFT_108350 [Lottia gigantea]ESO84226.1 hypothetical protein LOTGIDRAFT_108350 [Lottia gigantea]
MNGVKKRDYESILAECLAIRRLYTDPEFPPDERSLYISNAPVRENYGRVIWKRPRDIVSYPVFTSDISRHDLNQGRIGNCWFVAAAAIICTSHRNILERIVPLNQSFERNYAGVFHFNFWWYGEWVEVVVDDYLPTNGRNLIFCQNVGNRNEFWSALLEKAYAKLRGGYSGLEGGKIGDALVDLTGGIGEVISIENKNTIPRNLFHILHKSIAMNSMVGASIHRPPNATSSEVKHPNGLYSGHAYSITGIKEVINRGHSSHLLRLRNPWGRGEWIGAWSDRSVEMRTLTPSVRNSLQVDTADDGEFWMSYGDVIDNFDEIEMCHLQPDALTEENTSSWSVTMYHDAWKPGLTAGGCGNSPHQKLYWRNPQFFVTLSEKDDDDKNGECTMIVSLTEKEKNNIAKIAIGFDIFQLKPLDGEKASRNALRLAERSGKYQFYREVTRRFEFPPGVYVIIPSTFHINEDAEFLLRIFTEKAAESG